jgi:hypothetical protein
MSISTCSPPSELSAPRLPAGHSAFSLSAKAFTRSVKDGCRNLNPDGGALKKIWNGRVIPNEPIMAPQHQEATQRGWSKAKRDGPQIRVRGFYKTKPMWRQAKQNEALVPSGPRICFRRNPQPESMPNEPISPRRPQFVAHRQSTESVSSVYYQVHFLLSQRGAPVSLIDRTCLGRLKVRASSKRVRAFKNSRFGHYTVWSGQSGNQENSIVS